MALSFPGAKEKGDKIRYMIHLVHKEKHPSFLRKANFLLTVIRNFSGLHVEMWWLPTAVFLTKGIVPRTLQHRQ